MKGKVSNKNGSSLVEMMLAMALMAVVMVPLFTMFIGSATMMKKSKENIELSGIEREIKAEIMGSSRAPSNTTTLDGYLSGTDSYLPALPGDHHDNYGVRNEITGLINIKYKYSITYLVNNNLPGNEVFQVLPGQANLNVDPTPLPISGPPNPGVTVRKASRYRVDIYRLKDLSVVTPINTDFEIIKSFYMETKYQ